MESEIYNMDSFKRYAQAWGFRNAVYRLLKELITFAEGDEDYSGIYYHKQAHNTHVCWVCKLRLLYRVLILWR